MAGILGHRDIGDGGVLGLAGAVRDHRRKPGLVGHFDGLERLGEGADLIDLDQDRIGDALFDPLGQAGRVGNEQIITDQLDGVADGDGQHLPAVPVIFVHAVLDGGDREFGDQVFVVLDHAGAIQRFTLPGQFIAAVLVEFAGRGIQRHDHVVARFIAGDFNRFHNKIKRFSGTIQARCEAAFVAHIGAVAGVRQRLFERMENFRAAAHGVRKRVRADRHNHEFLDINGIVGMGAAVDDIHHRHRQQMRVGAADKTVQRLFGVVRRGPGGSQANAQDGIGAEPAFIFGAVQFDHGVVDQELVFGIHARQRVEQLTVDRVTGFQYALAAIARLIAVAQFDRFVGAGGGARRHRGTAKSAVFQHHINLDGGVAAAVEDFAGENVGNGGHDVQA